MLQAQEIMTQNVVTIRGSATVADAVKLMKEKKLRGLIVEPRHEQDPYGIVTETDIVYKVAAFGHDPKTMRVYEIMAKPCVVVNPELGVGKTLLGIISVSDILFKSDFVEKPKRLFIEDEIEAAREDARAICAAKGEISPDCAAAWDVVEELQAEASHQRVKKQGTNSLQSYCEANPDALECRIYED
jgi:hypothetical protein